MKLFILLLIGYVTSCKIGYLCFNNTEIVCPGGYYCPIDQPNSTYLCYDGFYCPKGSNNVTFQCQWFSSFFIPCNAGTEKQNLFPFVIIILIISALFYILLISCSQKLISFTLQIILRILNKFNIKNDNYKKFTNGSTIEFSNLTLFTTNKIILRNCSGKFEEGTLTAIMGSSGAGKSSLSNSITGRLGKL
jgi:ABC-type multidrug transport system fused ATPase/permease subunit